MQRLSVNLLPRELSGRSLAGHVAVVFDVFRASTTICAALSAGAECVYPVKDLECARDLARRTPGALLGGERGGLKQPGFDLGNSPREYVRARVAGRPVILTTTNGTAAIAAAAGAEFLAVGCFANVSVVAAKLQSLGLPVEIVCAGTDGEPAVEDCAAAGALVWSLTSILGNRWEPNDAALLCQAAFCGLTGRLTEGLRDSAGGRNVVAIGLADDLPVCTAIDSMPILPVIGKSPLKITAG